MENDCKRKQSEEILSEIYRNVNYAMESIDDILPEVDHEGLKEEIPKCAWLLNDGRALRIRKGKLPYCTNKLGVCVDDYVSICDIPCDEFLTEPLVIELTW